MNTLINQLTDRMMSPFSTTPRVGFAEISKDPLYDIMIKKPGTATEHDRKRAIELIHHSDAHNEIWTQAQNKAAQIVAKHPSSQSEAAKIPGSKENKQLLKTQRMLTVHIAHKTIMGTIAQLRHRVQELAKAQTQLSEEKKDELQRQKDIQEANHLLFDTQTQQNLEDDNDIDYTLEQENDETEYEEDEQRNQQDALPKPRPKQQTQKIEDDEEALYYESLLAQEQQRQQALSEDPPENADDLYHTLDDELDRDATAHEIEQAYRDKALSAEDKAAQAEGKSPGEFSQMSKIDEAYDTLSDESKRDAYNTDNEDAGLLDKEESNALNDAREAGMEQGSSMNYQSNSNTPRPQPPIE